MPVVAAPSAVRLGVPRPWRCRGLRLQPFRHADQHAADQRGVAVEHRLRRAHAGGAAVAQRGLGLRRSAARRSASPARRCRCPSSSSAAAPAPTGPAAARRAGSPWRRRRRTRLPSSRCWRAPSFSCFSLSADAAARRTAPAPCGCASTACSSAAVDAARAPCRAALDVDRRQPGSAPAPVEAASATVLTTLRMLSSVSSRPCSALQRRLADRLAQRLALLGARLARTS